MKVILLSVLLALSVEAQSNDLPANPEPQCLQNQIGSCPAEAPEFLGQITKEPATIFLGELSSYESKLIEGFKRAAREQGKPELFYVNRYLEAKAKEQANLSTAQVAKLAEVTLFLFKSHKDAEGSYYHMLEGLAIMTLEIQKRIPDFKGFPLDIFLDRQYQDCRNAPGQIYSQDDQKPYMGVCFIFNSQLDAENAYSFGVTTYFQYWDLLQQLLKAEAQTSCSSAGLFKDGANRGNLWKPQADPKARCKNGTTVLLGEQYNGINQLDLLDKNCNKVASAEYFGLYNNSRPRFCFVNLPGSKFGNDSVYLSFSSELKKVENASNRED